MFIVGPSGSGKTTFLRLVTKEERADAGEIWVAGKEVGSLAPWKVPYLRRNIGCIFQDYRLLPERTVYENVAFALEVIGRSRSFVRSQVPQILELVGLGKKMDSRPNELSGGEQQRVAVARAFVNRPLILLADEPTGNLDPGTTAGIMRLLERINLYGTTVVMATHQQDVVDAMRKRVIELDRGQCCARPGKRRLRHGRRLEARRGCEIGKGATDDDGEPVRTARDGGQPSPQRSHDGRCDRNDGSFAHRARRGPDYAPGGQHGDGPVAGRRRDDHLHGAAGQRPGDSRHQPRARRHDADGDQELPLSRQGPGVGRVQRSVQRPTGA